jgi:hypothetical protein
VLSGNSRLIEVNGTDAFPSTLEELNSTSTVDGPGDHAE